MKFCLAFFLMAIAYQTTAMPPIKEDPDVEIKDTPEENYIDDDRVMDWDAVPDHIDDMTRVKVWFNDLMSSAHNEILMKAKLVVAVESPIDRLVNDLGVSPNDAQMIQNFAFAQLMKIRDLEQQQLQQQMMELEAAQMKEQGGHEAIYDFEQGHHDSYDREWDVQNPGAEDYDDRDYY